MPRHWYHAPPTSPERLAEVFLARVHYHVSGCRSIGDPTRRENMSEEHALELGFTPHACVEKGRRGAA